MKMFKMMAASMLGVALCLGGVESDLSSSFFALFLFIAIAIYNVFVNVKQSMSGAQS